MSYKFAFTLEVKRMKKSKLLLGALLLASVFAVTSCNIGGGQQQTSTSAQQPQNSSTSVNNPSSSSAQSQAGTSSQNTPHASSATPSSSQESSSVAPQQSSSETTPSASSSSVAPQQSSSEQTPATSSSSSETTPTTSSSSTEPTTGSTSQVTPTTSSSSEATPTTSSSQSQSTPTSTSSSSSQTTTKYLVQFLDDDDTSIYSEELAEGTQILAPTNPTKTATTQYAYKFDGWYTAKAEGTKVTSFPTVSEPVTYYARYTATAIDADTITSNYTFSFLSDTSNESETYKVVSGSYEGSSGNGKYDKKKTATYYE